MEPTYRVTRVPGCILIRNYIEGGFKILWPSGKITKMRMFPLRTPAESEHFRESEIYKVRR